MNVIVENCLIARFWRALAAMARQSKAKGILTRLGQIICGSLVCGALYRGLMRSDAACRSSGLAGLLRRCNALIRRIGAPFDAAYRNSIFYRFYSYCRKAPAFKGSLVLGEVFCPGFRVLLIYVFAFYLPIDWALRDVLKIAALASVWDEAFMLLAFFYIAGERMFGFEAGRVKTTPADSGILLFMGVGLALMIAVSPRMYIAVQGYRATVQYILWFFLMVRLFRDRRDVMRLYRSLVLIAFLISLHGIYQFIMAVPIPSHWQTSTEVAVRTRVFSIFGSPNIMGSYMVLFAPMAAALAYSEKDIRMKICAWGFTVLMCFACLFTFSRGAWLGMAVAVLVFALLVDRRLLLLLVLVAAGAMCVPGVYNRIAFLFTEEFKEASARGGRAGRWLIGTTLLKEKHPLLGFGLGRYGGAVAMNNQVETRFDYYYLDNYYMRIMVEMGYAGLTAYLMMLGNTVLTALRCILRRRGDREGTSALCAGMLAGMCGVLTHCLYENIFEEPYMMAYFWGIAAMIVFMGFLETKKEGNKQ